MSQNLFKKSHLKELHSQHEDELEVPKERYISPEKKTTNYWWIKISITI